MNDTHVLLGRRAVTYLPAFISAAAAAAAGV